MIWLYLVLYKQMETRLHEIVEEIEEQQRLIKNRQFHSTLNQPNLISISSANATDVGSADSFYKFTANMPRPALDVDTIQLVNANIPQCVQNIPDTACTFWYYRLSQYTGTVANPLNLYFVRLLPSYYKKEFIEDSQTYGYNQTFNTYQDVASQLVLSCQNDLSYDNLVIRDIDEDAATYKLQFLPSEISIPYDSQTNKFKMIGTNAETSMAYQTWGAGNTYALNEVVIYNNKTYKSLQNGNIGNIPSAPNSAYWQLIYVDIVADFDVDTPYRAGQYVAYNDILYYALEDNYNLNPPDINPLVWTTTLPTDYFYRYLITGYNDPNVKIAQGDSYVLWNEYQLFEALTTVEYNNTYWTSITQNKNFTPFTLNNALTWDVATLYSTGQFVLYDGVIYQALATNIGDQPDISPLDWTTMPWGSTTNYAIGDVVSYLGVQYRAIAPVITVYNIPNPLPTVAITVWKPLVWSSTLSYSVGEIVSYLNIFWLARESSAGYKTWDNTITYALNDIVFYAGSVYKSLQNTNLNNQPTISPAFWVLVSPNSIPYIFSTVWCPNTFWVLDPTARPDILGLYAITRQFDYVDTWDGIPQYPFPVGVAGQPFNPNPRRLLNSILGFTWNGVFNPQLLALIDTFTTPVATSTITTQLYNRLRPVPQYFARFTTVPSPSLKASTATATQTYTADGYCNLVYSSIMNIYASIVYGSTLDTQRNTSLLAQGTMDCGNLGVSFFNPFVNNPLKVSGSDIYGISIEILDECGEPYVLTNNAITTFVLKVAYKKDNEKKITE